MAKTEIYQREKTVLPVRKRNATAAITRTART